MKSKKILTLIFAVLLVFSLFGCGKKEPVADVEPQDAVEQEKLPPIVTEKDTPKQEPVELTQEELHALFKKEYDTERFAKSNLYADQYKDFYMKLPAREIGTQVDANVYSYIESTVKGAGYEGKILPDDGFEQYVSWRQQYEASLNKSTSTSNSPTDQEPSQQPSNNNNTSGSGNQSQPSGGSTPPNNTGNGSSGTQTPPPGVDPDDWYESVNGSADDKQLPKPDYEIIG